MYFWRNVSGEQLWDSGVSSVACPNWVLEAALFKSLIQLPRAMQISGNMLACCETKLPARLYFPLLCIFECFFCFWGGGTK